MMIPIKHKQVLKLNAIIFDMDGVITNTMPYHYQAWSQAFREVAGQDVTEEDVYSREGSKGSFALSEIFEQYGWDYSPDLLKRILARKEEIFPKIVKVEFIDGALDFLQHAKECGFQMALVTGTSREEMNKMLPQSVRSYFAVSVTGSDVVHGKPDPEPYLCAIKHLGLASHEVCVLENAPLGIRSAKAAGLRCLALATSLDAHFLREADHVFSSFMDMTRSIDFQFCGDAE